MSFVVSVILVGSLMTFVNANFLSTVLRFRP